MTHRTRLWAIIIINVLDIALLVAAQYVEPELLGQAAPLVTPVLMAVLAITAPALADAVAVERARRDPSRPAIPDDVRDPRTHRRPAIPVPPDIGGGAALALVILAAALSAALASGCSSGPQLPITTPVLHISCTWEAGACPRTIDGGVGGGEAGAEARDVAVERVPSASATAGSTTVGGCDCVIDRSATTAEAQTTGNEVRDNAISPRLDTTVSAIPGTP